MQNNLRRYVTRAVSILLKRRAEKFSQEGINKDFRMAAFVGFGKISGKCPLVSADRSHRRHLAKECVCEWVPRCQGARINLAGDHILRNGKLRRTSRKSQFNVPSNTSIFAGVLIIGKVWRGGREKVGWGGADFEACLAFQILPQN